MHGRAPLQWESRHQGALHRTDAPETWLAAVGSAIRRSEDAHARNAWRSGSTNLRVPGRTDRVGVLRNRVRGRSNNRNKVAIGPWTLRREGRSSIRRMNRSGFRAKVVALGRVASGRRRGEVQTPYRFGSAELRPIERELWIEGGAVAIGRPTFDLLRVLIERRERVVTKDELLTLVWP